MSSTQRESRATTQTQGTPPSFVVGLWGVRYQVTDVARSVAFYTKDLGFKLDRQNLPAFAQVSIGHLKLILSGPGASGSRLMPDGRRQEPGGWNRVVLQVRDLPARIAELNPLPYAEAQRMEWVLARELRSDGYAVWQK